LLGESIAMRRLFGLLEHVARTDATVLIEGETGTGKELIAEALHEESLRSGGPFVVFDCSGVQASVLESELFGHVRGAFTGAVADRVGAAEAADGGTLFLDEIGELPLELQPKLLRLLEQREVRPVGQSKARTVDLRIIAATNRSLSKQVERGRFREDLYYRLAVVVAVAPPLRERMEDVPMLVEHFFREFARRERSDRILTPSLMSSFTARSWSGNVRELRNAVERSIALGTSSHTEPSEATARGRSLVDLALPLKSAAIEFERAYLREALQAAGGNVTRAAQLAGTSREFVHRAIKRYNLRDE
jgi:transcriptional regulator with GAF, ATPase, and Fis domain